MQQSQKLNAQIGLEQRNSILQAWNEFKDSIFNVLFVILDKKSEEAQQESIMGLAFESGLDYLQMMAFPFSTIVLNAWNGGDTLNNMSNLFQLMNVTNYLPGAPFSAFLALLYILIFIILLIILDIVYVSYSFTKKKFRFTFPLVLLAQIVPLFVTVLFLPITQTLLNVVQCQDNSNGINVMSNFPDVVCWEGWHLFHASVTLLFCVLFIIISTVVALALFEPRMTTKKLTARQNSNGQVVFIINKCICQFFFSFMPFSGSVVYVIMLFVLSCWQFWCYNVKQPYYSKSASKFFKICSTYYFWTNLMLFISQVLIPSGFDGGLVVWASGLPFFAVLIYFESTQNINKLFSSNLKFKSGEQLQNHLNYVLQLIQNQGQDKNSHILLIGYIEKHKQICPESDCPLKGTKKKKKKRKDGESEVKQNCEQLLKQVERMYKAGIKKFPQCTKLRISYAFFHLQQTKNKQMAYEQFTNASKINPTFQQQFNIYRFKKIIRQNLENNQQNSSDLVQMIRFQNHVSLCEQAMLLSAKLHKQFWTQLKQQIPDLKKLNRIGAQITETGNAIKENYIQLSKINNSSCEVLYSYAYYLILISEDLAEGRELLTSARKIYQDRQSGNRKGKQISSDVESINRMMNPILILSSQTDTFGRILNSNLMFTEITGYKREELFNREITKIAPNIYSESSHQCFKLHEAKRMYEQSHGNLDKKFEEGFINHKFNHLIPVQYSITYRPSEEQFHLVFKLTSYNNLKILLLANEEGEITDYNLLGQTCLKEILKKKAQESRSALLSSIGLTNFTSLQFGKQNGHLTTIKINGKYSQCNVQVTPIEVKAWQEGAEDDEEEGKMLTAEQKFLGYRIQIIKNQHIAQVSSISSQEVSLDSQSTDKQNNEKKYSLDNYILQLYDNPKVHDIYLSNRVDSKQQEHEANRFQLKEKIKTMRLLNNQIKMVYNQSNDGQYSDGADALKIDQERQLFKFDDENYQTKLRNAINTNLNHIQVSNLKKVSILFLFLLFTLNILEIYLESVQINAVDDFIGEISDRAHEYSILTKNLMTAIDTKQNYTQAYIDGINHQVTFTTTEVVEIQLQNNYSVTKNLKDAVILLNSRILNYFQNPTDISSINIIFLNYIENIYPAFLNYPTKIEINKNNIYIISTTVGILALFMMSYWIFIGLKIDKKRYDIMIWFLDIPITYVMYLGNHCDRYLKQFISIKELSQNGINMDQQEDSYEEYSSKKNAAEDEEIQEQIKARKSLISKNKKETLLSKINLSSLKVLWVLIYSFFFSGLLLILSEQFYSDFTFLLPQWVQTSNSITIDSTLYLSLQMQQNNINIGVNLSSLTNDLKLAHKGVTFQNNLESFNFNILDFHLTDVSDAYNNIYFLNLCTSLQNPYNLSQCETLVGNKLNSGYEVYSKYLIAAQSSGDNGIRLANQYYVVPALLQLIDTWEYIITGEANNMISICTILLYVFIIVSALAFLLFWLYYLRKLNTELNQTIQMLNMIPFKLLPKSRKQTKMFIAWIIREANKKKHENQ